MSEWRLFVPAEDWQHPIAVEESELPLLAQVAERLSLRMTRDDQQKKFYLGLPVDSKIAESSGGGEGVKFPSGVSIPKAVLSVAEAARYGTTGIYTAAPLLAAKDGDRLSTHFKAGEFRPRDSSFTFLRISPELVRRLEKIRTALGGAAITVHSAYRPPEYNRSVGGVSNSAHVDGLAADISAAGIPTEALHKVCEVIIGDDGGLGYYPSQQFCHVDVRGYRSRWDG